MTAEVIKFPRTKDSLLLTAHDVSAFMVGLELAFGPLGAAHILEAHAKDMRSRVTVIPITDCQGERQ